MTTRSAEFNRWAVHRLVATRVGPDVTDRELLERFTNQKDEEAFEALVRRHADMVFAVSRRLLGNSHDAEDVCQAVFLLLARKATSCRWQPSVANWLHQTARNLALKARTAAARRTHREERTAVRAPANPLAEMTGRELLAILDEELLALPESLRAPLVLCYLEGATRDEAAARLGCALSTLKKRLERGRDRLHEALVRRGFGLAAALLGTLATREAVAAPVTFARQTAQAAQALAAGSPTNEVVSSRVSEFLEGGCGMLGMNKVKLTLGALLVSGLLLAAAYGAANGPLAPPAMPVSPETKTEPTKAGSLKVIVLDPQGKPVSGANVIVSIWTEEKDFLANRDLETDLEGTVHIKLPRSFTILRLWAGKKSFATLFANWERAEATSNKVPVEYTFRLEPATTASGRILDERGKPIAGARVEVHLVNDPKPTGSDTRVRFDSSLAWGDDAAITDAEGRWRVHNVPDHPETVLSLLATHPDFVSSESERQAKVPAKTFWEGKAVLTLKSGIVMRGRVTDPEGRPVKDAIIIHGDDPYRGRVTSKFATDPDGRYRLPALAPGTTSLTALAPGWAPQLRKVELKPDLPAQDFRLGPGKPIRLRVVDAAGKPVPGAEVALMEWKGSKSISSQHNPNHPKVPDVGIPHQAGADGVWEWPSAPEDLVKLQIVAQGFAPFELEIAGGSAERTVKLGANHRIAGAVTDAVTGKPIPAFIVIPVDVFGKDFLLADRDQAVVGKEGRINYLATRTDIPLRLRIEAPGYRTQDGPEFRVGDQTSRTQHFRLQPSPSRTGKIVDPVGRPVAKAEVLLATPTQSARTSHDGLDYNHKTFTDAAGRFTFPDPGEPWAVIAQTHAGVVSAEFPADRFDVGTLKLRPWGAVRGTFSDGGKPVQGATVLLGPVRTFKLGQPRLEASLVATTDSDGRFEFPRVPPGPVVVRIHLGPWKDEGFRSGPMVPLELEPGGRVNLDLGTGGSILTGKVKLSGKIPTGLDCTYSLNYLIRRVPGIAPSPGIAELGFDVRKGWQAAWLQTEEGQDYLRTLKSWFVKLSPDGSFRVSGVPAGEYDLAVTIYAKPSGCLVEPLASRVVRVTVTAADAGRGELAVPDVVAEVVPAPAVGDTPILSFERPDGNRDTIEAVRGKYVVVHFWASWCVPCKKQLPALRKLHERFAGRGLVALGLAIDDDSAVWRSAIKGLDLPWSQGLLRADGVPVTSGVPTYWLLDPKGKIVAKASDLEELATAIEERLK